MDSGTKEKSRRYTMNEFLFFFYAGLVYAGLYDLVKTKLSFSASILMSVGLALYFATEQINIDALYVAISIILGILTFPVIITRIFNKVHIYFWDCLVLSLLVLANVNRLTVFLYYLTFIPLAYVLYLKTKKKDMFVSNEVPFLFVLTIAVAMAEAVLYVYSSLLPSK